ncbi:MAG: hypothetical protein ACKVHF_04635 [Candidatus Poseidoniales archaeon]|jgi:hypothetical protein
MPISNAIKNQVAGAVARQSTRVVNSGLKRVMGNIPGMSVGRGADNSAFVPLNNASGTMNLSYPLNVEDDQQQGHYIMFMVNSTTQPKIAKGGKTGGKAGIENQEQVGAPGAGKANQERLRSAGNGIVIKRPPTYRLEKAISLYMPPSVKVNYGAQYKDDEIGAITQTGVEVVNAGIEAFASGKMPSMTSMKKIGSSIGQAAGIVGIEKAMQAADATVTQGLQTAVQISSGRILSNKFELMFTDVGRRQFSFTFNFLPKSEQESEMVEKIVHAFKRHMLPEYETGSFGGVSSQQGRVMRIPDTFDIQYMWHSSENPWINKISTCYLTNLDVEYGGDKYATFEPLENKDGKVGPPPMKTAITLNFNEIEKITRERVDEGF